jgi:hypothetical protein
MDDLQFYLVNEYCPRCNSVTAHDAFEVNNEINGQNENSPVEVEHSCSNCQSREI